MLKILVSACLLGENCKYNGKNNLNEKVISLQEKCILIPICPEVLGNLPTPRIPSEVCGEEVFDREGKNVTKNFQTGAYKALQTALNNHIHYALLKEKSPSCGVKYRYDGTFTGTVIEDSGITTKILQEHNIKVFSELEIDELLKEIA